MFIIIDLDSAPFPPNNGIRAYFFKMSYWQLRNIRTETQSNHTKHIVNTLTLEIVTQYGVKQALEEQLKDFNKALKTM